MIGKKGEDKLGELTPFLRNVIIVASLFVAVMIVLIIVYNVVSIDTETKKAEDALDLNIVKNSVKLDNGILKLSVGGKLEDLELAKVKFIISDGTNEKDISLDAEGFETQKSFQINLKELGIDYTKKITISIKPIIKKLTGEKELKVTDKISVSPSGETIQEEIPVTEEKISTTITGCDKCGGIFGKGCDKILCHSISEGCYYKGGFTRDCASCSEMECGKYKTQTDCTTDRCKLGLCIWEKDECIKNPECGNGNVNSAANEECDDGNLINTDACTSYCKNAVCGDGYIKTGVEECDKGGANGIACTPSYGGGTCQYCGSNCKLVNLTGGTCGDTICNGAETYSTCPGDCSSTCGDGVCASGEICSTCPGDCKKCNGETCTADNQCQSNICGTNIDNDNYFSSALGHTGICQATSKAYTDCDDSNVNIWQLLSCYTDGDGDSYGAGSASSTCATSCATGKVTNNQDCLDSDNQVNPVATYHTTQHPTRGWDWDCSGSPDKNKDNNDQYNGCYLVTGCSLSGSCDLCTGSYATLNWQYSLVDCGQTFTYYTDGWQTYYNADGCLDIETSDWSFAWGFLNSWNICEGDHPPQTYGPNGGISCGVNTNYYISKTCSCK